MTELTAVGPGAASALIEREQELSAIAAALADAARGTSRLVIVEGEAGIGKSAVLRHADSAAAAAGMTSLRARGSELEQNYPFGIVLDLFRPILVDHAARERLLDGAASLAAPIFAELEGGRDGSAADPFAIMHGLYWLTVGAADRAPLLLLVDDAHWADDASLRFVHYLAQRMERLSLAIVLGLRPGEGAATSEPAQHIVAHPAATHVVPSHLTRDGIRRLVAGVGRDLDESVAERCWEATLGNPFLATELARSIGGDADGPMPASVPEAVSRSILGRLGHMGDPARRVAECIAVLGEEATVEQVAQLAGATPDHVADIVRRLSAAAILDRDRRLDFVHPITRSAVYEAMPSAVRALAHRRAAAMLDAQEASPERVAVHLLATEPAADQKVVEVLRQAAQLAMVQAAPSAARTYLRRALAEPPLGADRARVLLELARADAALGTELTVTRYRQALEAITDPVERAQVSHELGHALINEASWDAAADVFRDGIRELDGRDRALESRLEAGFVSAAFVSVSRRDEAHAVLGRILGNDLSDSAHRELAVWAAFQQSAAVSSTADAMVDLVERALVGTTPEEQVRSGQLVEVAAGVLVSTDALDREVELLTDGLDAVQRLGLQAKFGTYSYCRAWPHYYMGRLTESMADAQAALSAHELGWEVFYPATCAVLAWSHIERGETDEAERVAAVEPERWGARLDYQLLMPITLGRIALARGRFEEAARQFARGREAGAVTGVQTPVPPDWRTWLAVSLTRLGRRADARDVAREAVELAERWGAHWPLGVAYRAAGLAEGGAEGIALVRRGVELLETGSARLEHARAVIVLGELLRRAGETVEAREVLTRGVDLAHRLGAHALVERGRSELIAAGARPRRYAVTGVEALTPSELRVARMAAEGRTNRELAQQLFVTPKAVEYHLANAYRKLGIGSRAELAGALAETRGEVSV